MTGMAKRSAPGTASESATAKRAVTGRRQKPCSHPPKPRPGAYARRPGAGPGRTPQRAQRHGIDRRPVQVLLPDEPPTLTPAAARALLRVLLKAHAARNDQEGDRT
jgi:hypothetical protein